MVSNDFSLLLRFTEDSFDPDQGPTIGSCTRVHTLLPFVGVDFKPKLFDVNGNRVKLSIWVGQALSSFS